MSNENEPEQTGSNGARLRDGTFGPGNRYGKGCPTHVRMRELRASLIEALDPDTMKRVSTKLIALAEAGDMDAIRTLFAYAIGKPPRALELTGPDGNALGVDLVSVKVAILAALGDDSSARFKVARALMSLGGGGEVDGPGDDAGV